MANYMLHYMNQTGEHQRNNLRIDEEGKVTLHIEESGSSRSPRALGWFYLPIGHNDPDLNKIGKLIRENSLVGGKIFSTPLVFGRRIKIFNINVDGKETTHILNARAPMPAQFISLEQEIINLIKRLEKAPLRTFAMDIFLEPSKIKPGDYIQITFKFRNAGKFSTEFRNPATFTTGAHSSLLINLWRQVKRENGSLIDEYETAFDLSGCEFLTDEHRAINSTEPFLRIPPGEVLCTWTKFRFPKAETGTHIAEPIYYGGPMTQDEEEKRHDLLVGRYQADLKNITVVKN